MTIKLQGIEIELPNDAKVDVSEDGKHVKIDLPEAKLVETIRVVEQPGEPVEVIRIVEVPVQCDKPHYPTYTPTYPSPRTYPWGGTTGEGPYTNMTGTITTTKPHTSGYVNAEDFGIVVK